jgi:hypothetical protein
MAPPWVLEGTLTLSGDTLTVDWGHSTEIYDYYGLGRYN